MEAPRAARRRPGGGGRVAELLRGKRPMLAAAMLRGALYGEFVQGQPLAWAVRRECARGKRCYCCWQEYVS